MALQPNEEIQRERYTTLGNPDLFWDSGSLSNWLKEAKGPQSKKDQLLKVPESTVVSMLSELSDVISADTSITKWSFIGDKSRSQRAHSGEFKINSHRVGIDFPTRWLFLLPRVSQLGEATLQKVRPPEADYNETIYMGPIVSWYQHQPDVPLKIEMRQSGASERTEVLRANDPEIVSEREYVFRAVFASYVKFCPVEDV